VLCFDLGFAQKLGYQPAFSADSLSIDEHRIDAHHFLCKAFDLEIFINLPGQA
jgi:hypothetical protein